MKQIESNIKKAYSLFFQEKLLSRQEIMAIAKAPPKLQLLINKFQSCSLPGTSASYVKSLAVEELAEDYRPKQAELLFDYVIIADINLEPLIGRKLNKALSLMENNGINRSMSEFKLVVGDML